MHSAGGEGLWAGNYGGNGNINGPMSPESKEGFRGYAGNGANNVYASSNRVVAPSNGRSGGMSDSYGKGGGTGDGYGKGGSNGGGNFGGGGGGQYGGYGGNGSTNGSTSYESKANFPGYGGNSNGYGGNSNGYGGNSNGYGASDRVTAPSNSTSNGYGKGGGKSDSYGMGGGAFGGAGGGNGNINGSSGAYGGNSNGYGTSNRVMATSDGKSGGKSDSYGKGGGQSGSTGIMGRGDALGGGGGSGYGAYAGNGGDSYGKGGGKSDSYGKGGSNLGANLQNVDWSKEDVAPIAKTSESYMAAAGALSKPQIDAWKQDNTIQTWGRDVANPILSFEETGFPQFMLDSFRKQGFQAPTIIQQAGWGPAMAGRDLVGVAKTGSGKTLGFGIPGLLHIAAQPKLNRGDGPMMLVLAPTRELGQQIHVELQKVMPNDIRGAIIFGGAPKYDQKRELRWGVHVLVATPGRLIDFIETGITNLKRVTYLVMDEADRMLDMGFEPDVRKIVAQCPPNRQTLLFSATWPTSIQRLARDFQQDIVHIQVGSTELSANDDITQKIIMTHGWQQKQEEIVRQLMDLDQQGIKKVLVFSSTKKGAEELSNVIRQAGFLTGAIHGDKEQYQREQALHHLKTKPRFVLVATDVASRGLDIPKLPAVINFDFPDQLEDYVHRIGRTGRAGNKGLAITFFTAAKDCGHAAKLMDLLRKAGQEVPHGLQRCTTMTPPEKDRSKWGKKNGGGGGGGGGGYGGGGKGGGKGGWKGK